MKERMSMEDRYKGTILGVAVGDALGQPIEYLLTEEEIEAGIDRYGQGKWVEQIKAFRKMLGEEHGGIVREMFVNPYRYWNKGEYTDDTAQTLLLVDSFVEKGYDPEDFAGRLLEWFDHGKARGMGSTTRKALSLIEKGESWQTAGKLALEKGGVASNGSLMRTAPVGLYFRGYTEKIDKAAEEISIITHAADPAIETCQMASHLISQLVNGVPKNEAINHIQSRFGEIFTKAFSVPKSTFKPGGAYESFSIALIAFDNAKNFEDAVVSAVNTAGDTDSYGAIAGAFAGAHWGIAQIPDRWAKELNPQNARIISNKAAALYSLSS